MILSLMDRLGVNALFRFLNRKRAIILYYHGICEDDFDLLKGYDVRQLPRSVFRRQLEFLRDKGYRFVSLEDLIGSLSSRGGAGKRLVTLSIDDGLRNVVRNAYPIMKELGAKGCFYLVSDLIGSGKLIWTDHVETVVRSAPAGSFEFRYRNESITYELRDEATRRLAMKDMKRRLRRLSDRERLEHLRQFDGRELKNVPPDFELADWGEIRGLDPEILMIGSHTRNHPNCTQLESDAEFEAELSGSARDIAAQVGYPIRHFCYPAGAYDERVIAKLRAYGYTSAVTSEHGFADASLDPFHLKRIEADSDFTVFKADVSGSHAFFSGLKARFFRQRMGKPTKEKESAS